MRKVEQGLEVGLTNNARPVCRVVKWKKVEHVAKKAMRKSANASEHSTSFPCDTQKKYFWWMN